MKSNKANVDKKKKIGIAVACLCLTATIIAYRLMMIPLNARQVVQRSFECYDLTDARCLLSLSLSHEMKSAGVTAGSLEEAIGIVSEKLPPNAQPVGDLSFMDIEQQGAKATRQYVSSTGESYSVTFTARRTEVGFLIDNLLVSVIVSPLLTVSKNAEPASPQGFDKIRRLRQIAEFGQSNLEATGIKGIPEYGDLGLRVRTWSEMIGKYDAGLSAQGISPLGKL